MLVDKDQSPKWDPPTLEGVTNEHVDWYFSNLPEDRELKLWYIQFFIHFWGIEIDSTDTAFGPAHYLGQVYSSKGQAEFGAAHTFGKIYLIKVVQNLYQSINSERLFDKDWAE